MGFIRQFIKLESASGILLMLTAVLALLVANSPLSAWYDALLSLRFQISLGDWMLGKPLLLWINDGLMRCSSSWSASSSSARSWRDSCPRGAT